MNHESVPPTGAEADDSRREVEALADALESCARLTGVPLEAVRARESAAAALRQRPGRDPESRLEQLVHAGEDCGLRVAVVRLARRDIPWQARPDCPLVVPDPEGRGWAVLARRGLFRMHLHRTGHPPLEKVGPAAARAAVGEGPGDGVVPVALVHPAMPLAPGASADAHHEHLSPLRRLLGILRPELPDIGTLLIFSFVTGILYLSVPLAVDAVVNNIAFGGQLGVYRQALFIVGVALFGVLGLLAAVRAVQHYVVEIIQRRLFVRLGADLAFRLPRVRLSALDNVHGPELVNRFFDVVTVQKSSALILLDGINLLLSTVIGLLVLGFYHPSLLAFSLALLLLLLLIIFPGGRGAVATSIRESAAKYEMAAWLEQLAESPVVFKAAGGAALAMEKADLLCRRYLDRRHRHFRILMRQIIGLLSLQALASSALLLIGGFLVLAGELTLGQLVAAELIVTAIVASIAKLGKQFESWYDALTATDKLGHLVDLPIEREGGEVPAESAQAMDLAVDRLVMAGLGGHGDTQALSFRAEPGFRLALTGPEGCGASRFIDVAYGLREPRDGHLNVDRLDLRHWDLAALRRQVALIRGPELVAGTVADNIRLGRMHLGLDVVTDALRGVGLLDDILHMSGGLQHPLLMGGRPLTSGQALRLAVARALVGKPRLILIDRVLDGIEPGLLEQLCAALFPPHRPWTVIVVTRDPAVARRCDRTVNLGPSLPVATQGETHGHD